MRAKPPVVNGEPRSEVNTNGDLGACSRRSRRRARSSSPRTGWVPGVPRFTLRTFLVPQPIVFAGLLPLESKYRFALDIIYPRPEYIRVLNAPMGDVELD